MTTQPTRITFVRHGHVHNPDNIVYGRLPGFHLSEMGREQAAATAERLATAEIAALFTSPQLRARETAEILKAHHPDLTIQVSPLINETLCFFEGRPQEEVEARGWDLYTGIPEGYEMPEDIAARGARFIRQVREAYAGRHVVAVTHGDVIAFTVLWAMGARIHMSEKRTLHRFGVTDTYPATGSLTTLGYSTNGADDGPGDPPQLTYIRPYADDVTWASV
ncbi:MAG: histidine phosphatase family protein [Anaerolineae bacterium]